LTARDGPAWAPPGPSELAAILDRLPFGIMALDDRRRVIVANTAAGRFFHPGRLVRGRPLPPARVDFDLEEFVNGLFDRLGPVVERDVLFGDRTLSVRGVPAGNSGFVVLMLEDISAHSQRERARREFVGNAAHELLTPLTGIVGAAHALEAGAKDVPEMRERFIGHITRECARLARIARGLLVLARARSGEEPPRPDVVAVSPLLDDVLGLLDTAGDVEVRCPEISIFVDRDLAEQALVNLVANAKRHSSGGTVRIEVAAVNGGLVAIDVVDSGTGMNRRELERMRRRFASGGGRDGGGFGLGVSIAQQAVEELGGTLTFDSAPGAGTRAHVEFPAA
jgi:two-component system, OmpR family, phosphate regulon sensor histidine kinase PhoR